MCIHEGHIEALHRSVCQGGTSTGVTSSLFRVRALGSRRARVSSLRVIIRWRRVVASSRHPGSPRRYTHDTGFPPPLPAQSPS